jgi:hypothetical protein
MISIFTQLRSGLIEQKVAAQKIPVDRSGTTVATRKAWNSQTQSKQRSGDWDAQMDSSWGLAALARRAKQYSTGGAVVRFHPGASWFRWLHSLMRKRRSFSFKKSSQQACPALRSTGSIQSKEGTQPV